MIEPCAEGSKQTRERALAVLKVMAHIADIIEVQHSHARQSDCDAAPERLPCHRLRLQVVRTHSAEQTEEEEHAQIAQAHIAVTMLAQRIGDGTDNGQCT